MSFEEHIEIFKRITDLVKRRGTGNISTLAKKLMLSERQVARLIKILKKYAPIEWSPGAQSYVFYKNGKFKIFLFENEPIDLEFKKDGQYNHQDSK